MKRGDGGIGFIHRVNEASINRDVDGDGVIAQWEESACAIWHRLTQATRRAQLTVGIDGKDYQRARTRNTGAVVRLVRLHNVEIGTGRVDRQLHRVAAWQVAGLLGIEFAIGANGEFHDRIVVMIDDVEILTIGRGHISDGIPAAGAVRRVSDLVQTARLRYLFCKR